MYEHKYMFISFIRIELVLLNTTEWQLHMTLIHDQRIYHHQALRKHKTSFYLPCALPLSRKLFN